jgi:hypothetical protein
MTTPSPTDLLNEGLARGGFTKLPVAVELPTPGTEAIATATISDPDAVARGRVLMVQDPSGAATFHLPVAQPGRALAPQLVFDIPAARLLPVEPRGKAALLPLGPVATLLAHDVGNLAGVAFAKWYSEKERREHPHRIRHVTTRDGRFAPGDDVSDWSALRDKTVLLFVHGVLSSSQNCFHGLRSDLVESLSASYPAVLCFDHPTVSVDPRDNLRWFLEQIPPGIDLRFRIIAHSRGGLISRILAGGLGAAFPVREGISVETIALAGTPNLGTPIVSIEKWGALVDRLANLAAWLPGPFHDAGQFIADVLQLLKAAAADATERLPGLTFMLDGQTSGVLADLDAAPATTNNYYAVDTEFWPDHLLWHIFNLHRDLEAGAEVLVDNAVFDHVPNDIAVPTSGVRGAGLTGGGFPITAGRSFGRSDTVWHCSYFDDERTWNSLRTWFLEEQADL